MACRNLFVIAAICITLNTTSPETTSAQDEKICPVCHWPIGHPCCEACRDVGPDGFPTDENVRREMIVREKITDALEQLTAQDDPVSAAQTGLQLAREVRTGNFTEETKRQAMELLLCALKVRALAGDNNSRMLLATYATERPPGDDANHVLACMIHIQTQLADRKNDGEGIRRTADILAERYGNNRDARDFLIRLVHTLEQAANHDDALSIVVSIEKHCHIEMTSVKRRLSLFGKELTIQGESFQGQSVSAEQYRGKVVVIQFWATWCAPCLKELKHLTQLKAGAAGDEFELIGVPLDDDRETLLHFLDRAKPIGQQLESPSLVVDAKAQPLADYMGITSTPTLMFLDRQGRLQRIVYTGDEVESIIRSLSNEGIKNKSHR